MQPLPFFFDLGATVTIKCSGEIGTIIGRAQYSKQDNSYLVRYKAGDGRATEVWWGEDALSLIEKA